jgi:hypothetical protein
MSQVTRLARLLLSGSFRSDEEQMIWLRAHERHSRWQAEEQRPYSWQDGCGRLAGDRRLGYNTNDLDVS